MQFLRTFQDYLGILSSSDRRKYWTVVAIQAVLGFLDLFGVVALGVVGALAIRGVQSQPPSQHVLDILETLKLERFSLQQQVAILGILTAGLLIFRTILSMYFTWKILNFLAARSADISSNLLSKIVGRGLVEIQQKSLVEIQFILGPGVSSIAVGILGTASIVFADISMLIIVAVGVLIIDPVIAIASIALFSGVGLFLHFSLRLEAERIGLNLTATNIKSNQLLNELIVGFREVFVRNREGFYSQEIIESKREISKLLAKNSFIPNIGKYAIEVAVVFGGALIAAAQFIMNDATHAFASLAVFIAAGTRIAPALLRLQQGAIGIKSNIGMSKLTLLTIQKFKQDPNMELISRETDFLHKGFNPNIMLRDVKFYYDQRKQPNLEIDNLYIPPGRSLAVVGPSGAGKTTLVDVMLGILEPSSGFINISGQNPRIAISKWPGAIAYVPQDVLIIEGTIAENVALGYGQSSISKKHVKIALQIAQLTDFVETLPHGADTKIGERGIGLSGGQRQRLGIARAMYTQPRLLVLDEATSALDGITESEVIAAIANLQTNATRIIIAHRLSTVVSADQVIYISNGKIIASGKFEEIRSKIPDFDKQAKLMGL